MNKQRRNELTQLKYKKRIQRWVANMSYYISSNGEWIKNPKAVDVIKDNGQLLYKTTSVPCSCWGCSGAYKYKRHEQKREDRRVIQEGLEDFQAPNDSENQ